MADAAWLSADPPWRLAGDFVGMVGLVPIDEAERHVPDGMRLARVFPGYTLGAIFAARYAYTPVGEYSELGILPALVHARGVKGFWCSHMYVDKQEALDAGRDIWGLPKEMAVFEWSSTLDSDGRDRDVLLVKQNDKELLHIEYTEQPIPLPGGLKLSMIARRGDRTLRWKANMKSRSRKVFAEVFIPSESPFGSLRPLPSTSFAGQLHEAIIGAPF